MTVESCLCHEEVILFLIFSIVTKQFQVHSRCPQDWKKADPDLHVTQEIQVETHMWLSVSGLNPIWISSGHKTIEMTSVTRGQRERLQSQVTPPAISRAAQQKERVSNLLSQILKWRGLQSTSLMAFLPVVHEATLPPPLRWNRGSDIAGCPSPHYPWAPALPAGPRADEALEGPPGKVKWATGSQRARWSSPWPWSLEGESREEQLLIRLRLCVHEYTDTGTCTSVFVCTHMVWFRGKKKKKKTVVVKVIAYAKAWISTQCHQDLP